MPLLSVLPKFWDRAYDGNTLQYSSFTASFLKLPSISRTCRIPRSTWDPGQRVGGSLRAHKQEADSSGYMLHHQLSRRGDHAGFSSLSILLEVATSGLSLKKSGVRNCIASIVKAPELFLD